MRLSLCWVLVAQGGADADFYYFRHWHAIDLFIYFSHHLVTIPPVGWVNAGHRHGVPVRAASECRDCPEWQYFMCQQPIVPAAGLPWRQQKLASYDLSLP